MSPRPFPGGRRVLAAGVSATLILGLAPRAEDEVAKTLALPISTGSIALLAPHAREHGVSERLRRALIDTNPDVRGVAARVVDVAGLSDLLPEVSAALGRESDPAAAREQIRALCALGGPSYDSPVLAAAGRFSPILDAELVRIVARARGPAAFPLYFNELYDSSLASSDREAFFRIASRGQPDSLSAAVSMALGRGDAPSFQAAVHVATELELTLDQPVFVQAMRSDQPSFRGEAAWYLARTYCDRPPQGAEAMLEAASETGTAPPPGADPELRFGVEVLRRVLGEAPVEDEEWIACLESNLECHLDSDLGESPLIEFLTPREREAVLRRNDAGRPREAKHASKLHGAAVAASDLRLVTGLPRGLARDLFRIEGCRFRSGTRQIAVAAMRFRADGLPQNVSILAVPRGKSCDSIAKALFTMSLAPDQLVGPDKRITYLAVYDADSNECGEESFEESSLLEASATPSGVLRVRASVQAPRILEKIEPLYPETARKNGEKGVSVYEAIIASTGCVRDVKLLKSSTPLLDVAGMEAVSRWIYHPATLDGRPVRVYLTVTVTFSLTKNPR